MAKRTITLAETPPPAPPHETANEILRAMRSRWKLIAAAMLLGAVAGGLIGLAMPKKYRASTTVAVVPRADAMSPDDQIRGIQALDQRTIVATVAALPSLPDTIAAIQGANGYDVRAVVLPNTNLLRIDVDGANPQHAADLANRVPPILSARTRAIYGLYAVAAVSRAASAELIFPRMDRIIAGGLVVGLIVGFTLAWMLSARRP